MSNCTTDIDCPGNLICYTEDVSWMDGESECLCSSWFGWEGPDCSEFGSGTIVLIVVACAGILLGAIGIVFSINVLIRMDVQRTKKKGSLNFYSLIISIVSNVFGFGVHVIFLLNLLYPEKAVIVLSSDVTGDKAAYLVVLKRVFISISSILTAMGQLNIGLVGAALKDTLSFLKGGNTSHYKRFKIIAIIIDIVLVVLMISLSILGYIDILTLALIPLWIFVATTYAFGVINLADTFKNMLTLQSNLNRTERLKKDVWDFRVSAFSEIIAVLCLIITAIVYALYSFNGWRNVSPPTAFVSPTALASNLLTVFVVFANGILLLLTGRNVLRASKMATSSSTITTIETAKSLSPTSDEQTDNPMYIPL